MKISNLEKELKEDMQKDLDGWAKFITNNDSKKGYATQKQDKTKIEILKRSGGKVE